MLRDITIGQYFPGNSWIHRLDPRAKILATFLFIAALFVMNRFEGYILVVAFLALVIGISRIPVKFIFRGLKPVLLIIIITFSLNMFMTKGTPVVSIGFLTITREGLYQAGFMAGRLITLIIGSSLLTLTTKPINLTDGIEYLLHPLTKIKVPAHEIAMMMTIALRFIPTLLDETDKIMKAQMARGADFESGNIFRRAKSLVPLLVPLFISAFRIAQDLAMAMEARCYRGGENRTRMNGMKLGINDAFAMFFMLLFLSVFILQRMGYLIL